jgi:type I restriction enzyme S subunit
MSEHRLPDGWRWVRLGDVCEINPRRPSGLDRDDDILTTFVPMSAVDNRNGTIAESELKPYSEVRKGYTYFEEDDILFAKITPCMQNGKHAIALGLVDGIGFGSTEFHVLRPKSVITSEWVHHFIRQSWVLAEAATHFTGAVGQQRVPEVFLASLEIPLPPLPEQRRIAAILTEQMDAIEQARAAAEAELAAAEALTAAYLREVFESETLQRWKPVPLGKVLVRSTEIVHPHDKPSGPAVFVGLEHIESGTGIRLGEVPLEMSELTGRKPTFYEGQIVYGYLRPYLNKVWIAEFDGLCSVDQYVYSVVPSLADTEFIAWFMRSPVYIERSPLGSNTSQLPRIRADEVASIEVNLPPLDEQKRIVTQINEYLTETYALCASLKEELEAISQLPAALLCRAFNGEL